VKKSPPLFRHSPNRAIFEPSPPGGSTSSTNENNMAHRSGQNRQQFGLFATPLDEMIAQDNLVRVIDAFVDAIDFCAEP
jgi:hypothetical protein